MIIVSDHGDQFYEHGSVGHGDTVYQELTHVPLIIRAPGLFPAGKVVQADVEVMDVYATLLDMAGLKLGPNVQGTSLVPLARDEVGLSPRAALTVDGQVARGLKVQRYRLVSRGPGIELYDEFADPREQKDVAAERPIALRGMRGVLGLLYAYESTWSKCRWGTAANVAELFYTPAGPPGHRGAEPKSGGPNKSKRRADQPPRLRALFADTRSACERQRTSTERRGRDGVGAGVGPGPGWPGQPLGRRRRIAVNRSSVPRRSPRPARDDL